MKFPNLWWAIAERGLAHYQVAAEVGMSETRFSRCLSGRADFSQEERVSLATYLGYETGWLFQEVIRAPKYQSTV